MAQTTPSAPAARRRAARYALERPVCCWTADGDVLEATTVNVGPGGMLLRTERPAPPVATTVHFRMALSVREGWAGAHVAGTGRIVRAVPAGPDGGVLVALVIDAAALCGEDAGRSPPPAAGGPGSPPAP